VSERFNLDPTRTEYLHTNNDICTFFTLQHIVFPCRGIERFGQSTSTETGRTQFPLLECHLNGTNFGYLYISTKQQEKIKTEPGAESGDDLQGKSRFISTHSRAHSLGRESDKACQCGKGGANAVVRVTQPPHCGHARDPCLLSTD